jgi:hypothetical protein
MRRIGVKLTRTGRFCLFARLFEPLALDRWTVGSLGV